MAIGPTRAFLFGTCYTMTFMEMSKSIPNTITFRLVYYVTIKVVIDSQVFTPGPVGGLQDAPGGVLEEACMRHL